jgi:phosphoglycolate phosphatase-like HAD superfamily hydrolase
MWCAVLPRAVLCCGAAGMKVVGVTTSLSPDEMQQQQPDLIFESISSITVSNLTGV